MLKLKQPANKPMPDFDIAICGAGPVGLTLALLLVARGVAAERLVLIDAKTAEQAARDQRTIALSYGSRQILQAAAAWPVRATAIRQIHVSRRGYLGRSLIDAMDQQVEALGYVARYADILSPLNAALEQHAAGLTCLRPAKVTALNQNASGAHITLEDGRQITAAIAVQAEGGVFADQTPQLRHHDYEQSAVITHITTSIAPAGRAYERFTDQGPLALLPQDNGYALVWCARPERAAELLALDESHFLAALQTAFGDRVGQMLSCTQRLSFALGLNAQTSPPEGCCIGIGNAAQTLHPVAGQGLNLGLRDAFVLARFLSRSISAASLQDFFQARQTDRQTTIELTDQMARRFASNTAQTLFSSGLGLIDLCAPAQSWLARQMMFGTR